MSASSLNDSEILRNTTYSEADQKGRVKLQYTLPSGRKIVSEHIVREEVKGKVLITWAEMIRAQDAFDIQERSERELLARAEKRASGLGSDAPTVSDASATPRTFNELLSGSPSPATSSAETSKVLSTVLPDDPGELIHAKLSALRTLHDAEVRRRDESIAKIAVLAENIDRWAAVSNALRIEEKPSDDSPQAGSEGTILDLPSVGGVRPDRPARTPRAQRRGRRAKGGADHGDRDGVQEPSHDVSGDAERVLPVDAVQ